MPNKPLAIRRRRFLISFVCIILLLAIVKWIFPDLTLPRLLRTKPDKEQPIVRKAQPDSVELHARAVDALLLRAHTKPVLTKADGSRVKNRVLSVYRFEDSFPDLNDLQLTAATRLGIPQIANRDEARRRMKDLVYIADSPYYSVENLRQSIPYLVPRAATLLGTIARAFNDSLATKGFEPHKLVITSVLRTAEDVGRLRKFNRNASENSCHQYGTTFDISYNRFLELTPEGESRIHWVTAFKSILAEVLRDQREAGTCYVKYEMHQSCFHITAR